MSGAANWGPVSAVMGLRLWQKPINLPCDLLKQNTDHFLQFNCG